MPHPHPQNRTRLHQVTGEQQYSDAKADLARSKSAMQTEAEAYGEAHSHEDEEARRARLEQSLNQMLQETNADIIKEQKKSSS